MIAEELDNVNRENIILSDPIKNSIMQYSNFYKLIYSNEYLSLNGLFILFKLNDLNQTKDKILFTNKNNEETIQKIIVLEEYILNLIYSNKNKVYKISDLFSNGFIKYCYNDYTKDSDIDTNKDNINYINNNSSDSKFFILKISGLWETKDNIGITFKIILIDKCIEFV